MREENCFYNKIRNVGRIGYGVYRRYEDRGNLKRGKCGEGKLKSIRGNVPFVSCDI
jgi:hypothetical protein